MTWRARWVVLLALSATSGCGGTPASPTSPSAPLPAAVSLTGTVSAQSGAKLADATVSILDGANALRFVKTNAAGDYRFDNLTPGNANLSAVKNGYEERVTGLFVDGNNKANFILRT